MSAPVFLAESADLSAFAPGSTYLLDGAEGRHAGVVQRRKVGEHIDVVDGAGVRLHCTIVAVHASEVHLTVDAQIVEPSSAPRILLVQALAKGDRDEMAVEAATEVGADGFIPWQADRSIVVWRGDRAAKSRARWLATVRTATKQARRARLAHVDTDVDSRALAQRVRAVCDAGGAALVMHEEATVPIRAALVPAQGTDADVLVIVGPEGGMTQTEVDQLCEAGAQKVRLGPHVLRTSTAGPIAIALLAAQSGLWS